MNHLYFAYGSNMTLEQMKSRCPDAVWKGRAVLKYFEIVIGAKSASRNYGVADVRYNEKEEVWGFLYELTDKDLLSLDGYEGHPGFYKRYQHRVWLHQPAKWEEDWQREADTIDDMPICEEYKMEKREDSYKSDMKELKGVWVYELVDKTKYFPSNMEYLKLILQPAQLYHLPNVYQNKLARLLEYTREQIKLNDELDLLSEIIKIGDFSFIPKENREYIKPGLIIVLDERRFYELEENSLNEYMFCYDENWDLIWLIEELRRIFDFRISPTHEHFFYGSIGVAISRYVHEKKDNGQQQLSEELFPRIIESMMKYMYLYCPRYT